MHTHWKVAKTQEKLLYKQNVNLQNAKLCPQIHNHFPHGLTYTHTQNIYSHPGDGWVNRHIDHLLIYRSSKHCKQRHGFFCFHKIHTQFIHLLEASQCDSLDVEQISLTYSIKTDRAVIQAYIKPREKLLLECGRYRQGFRFIYTAANSWLTTIWMLVRGKCKSWLREENRVNTVSLFISWRSLLLI